MNKLSKLLLAFAAPAMMLCSCNSDGPDVSKSSEKEGGFHATLTISLPAGSRSVTIEPGEHPAQSDDDFEVGKDYENNVGAVLVVLASEEGGKYNFITSSLANSVNPSGTNGYNPTYNVTFNNDALAQYAEKEVCVFTYCNPTEALQAKIKDIKENKKTEFTDLKGEAFGDDNSYILGEEEPDPEKGNFLMSNAAIWRTTLPSQIVMETMHDKPNKAFDLGTVRVERATARFDFKQTRYAGQSIDNLYPITDVNNNIMAYVQLDEMALLNVANEYYYLPRVSPNGFENNITICGQETPSNYVVSPYPDNKKPGTIDFTWVSANYKYYPGYVTVNSTENSSVVAFDYRGLEYEELSSIGAKTEDNDNTWNEDQDEAKKGYHIWKYVTENTIPEYSYQGIDFYQCKGVTTGVVFKGHLEVSGENTALDEVIAAGKDIIYAYNNVLYGNLSMLKEAVLDNPVSALAETFKEAYGIEEINDETVNDAGELNSTISGGFAIYRPDAAGQYPMYYSYWNRHNDNDRNTIMGRMEFCVVRNNVYKLSVQDIVTFGHPGDPNDDPDPDEPNDPDETPKVYFTVNVEVLPWVVRINNIIL